MKIYNTYSSSLEEFKPIIENEVSIYVCGPTVYDYIHIGNARPVVFFDVVRRYFESLGYSVKYASNFTDVDDKIINKAKQQNKSEQEVAEFYIQAFLEDVHRLGSKTDYLKPRVTKYMDSIIEYISELVEKGFAYEVDGDVYFRVSKIDEYGHLSNRQINDLISGARVEINEKKESPLDFTLWKKTEEGIRWNSKFSYGRPGWHTECCTMIDDLFGGQIDIHGGGSDLIFPHHENEIAQSMAMHHHPIAHYWMHNGRLNLDGEKMSKSLGNLIWVKDIEGDVLGFRLFLLATHYRSPINFSLEHLQTYQKEYAKWKNTVLSLDLALDLRGEYHDFPSRLSFPEVIEYKQQYDEALELDFNTPNAITQIQASLKAINIVLRNNASISLLKEYKVAIDQMLSVLGLGVKYDALSDENRLIYQEWEKARKEKDFELADQLRTKLVEKGIL